MAITDRRSSAANSDYRAFLQAFRRHFDIPEAHTAGSPGATLLAYCLMPNHYHLVIQPEDDDLSARMQRLLISFTKTINARYQRVGALFQGQFQAVAVETDAQLIHLTAYVHRNPVQAGLVCRPDDWENSSCREYFGVRPGTLPRPDIVLELCGGRRANSLLLRSAAGDTMDGLEHLVLEE